MTGASAARSKHQQLCTLLRTQIADGTLAPGTPTPSITALADRHGYARQTCAKALGMLQDDGLLTRVPGLGYYVTTARGHIPIPQAAYRIPPGWL